MWLRLLATAGVFLASGGMALADCNRPASIAFASGATEATIASEEPTPTIECYQVTAQTGQSLGALLESSFSGLSLEIFAPGWKTACGGSACDISGDLISEPGETDWGETLIETGAYLIVVVNPQGDQYKLTIELE